MTDCSLTDLTSPKPFYNVREQRTFNWGEKRGEKCWWPYNEVYDDHENFEAMPGPVRDSYQHLDGWILSTRTRLLVDIGWLGLFGGMSETKMRRGHKLFVLIKLE